MATEKLGVQMRGPIIDVLTLDHVLDENMSSYSLESVSNRRTSLKNIKDLAMNMRNDLVNAGDDVVIQYNGVDSDATLRSYNVMSEFYKKQRRQANYYKYFMVPVQTMLADAYRCGCLVDTDTLKASEDELSVLVEKIRVSAISKLPKHVRESYSDKKLNLNSRTLIEAAFKAFGLSSGKKTKTNKESFDEEALACISHPFVSDLKEHRKASKILSSYVQSIYKHIRADGRIHPSTLIFTTTGRTSMVDPAVQTFPRSGKYAKHCKGAIIADPGFVLCARDLSQSELRITGWLADDANILKALREGLDLHRKTAAIVAEVSPDEVTKDMRQSAKGYNFGLIYGISAEGLVAYMFHEYGIKINLTTAQKARARFFSRPDGYYSLPEYYEHVIEDLYRGGYVESCIGRRRHLLDVYSSDYGLVERAKRQAINFRSQSFSSDLGLIGMFLFWKRIKKLGWDKDKVKLLWFIHDAVMFQCRREMVSECMGMLKIAMEVDAPEYINKYLTDKVVDYPILSDGKTGANWFEMTDWHDNV
jgi:DNA polymerase-1